MPPKLLSSNMNTILIASSFSIFGPDHLTVLALTFLVACTMIGGAKKDLPKTQPVIEKCGDILAWILLLSHPAKIVARLILNMSLADNLWPMHLCNWAAAMGFFALRYRHPLMCELLYFWGLAATFQALITPNISWGFPHPLFIIFFLTHSGIVIGAVYLVFGAGMKPRPGAVWRAWIWMQVYVLCAAITNWLTQSNYGFLRSKPEAASLFDHLGPWPYYIIVLEIISLAIFALLNIPFFVARLRQPKAETTQA